MGWISQIQFTVIGLMKVSYLEIDIVKKWNFLVHNLYFPNHEKKPGKYKSGKNIYFRGKFSCIVIKKGASFVRKES